MGGNATDFHSHKDAALAPCHNVAARTPWLCIEDEGEAISSSLV
jgi:hypothetical protein